MRQLPGENRPITSTAAQVVAGVVAVLIVIVAVALFRSSPETTNTSLPPTSTDTPSAAVEPTGNTTEITLDVEGMSYSPSSIEVPLGDRLIVTLNNTGDQRHDLVFDNGVSLEALAPGQSATVDVGIIDRSMSAWCSITGHRQMGMVFSVIGMGSTGHDHGNGTEHGTNTTIPRDVPSAAELQQAAATHDSHPAALPPLPAGNQHHEYTFRVTEEIDHVTPDLTRTVWTYNGSSPGPTLHGRVGDTFEIRLINDGTMGHSIDFHAGELAPDGPMRTIEPGEELIYRFTANRSGVWLYHCGTKPMATHIASGMFGAVVIEPDGLEQVDHSFVLVQSELFFGADGEPADVDAVVARAPDAMAFNGRPFQYAAHPLQVGVGERVRMWILTAGPSESLTFHVVGAQFDTVWREGAYSVYRGASTDGITAGVTGAQALSLGTAEGGFVEFETYEAGNYPFLNHVMALAEMGALGVLEVTP